MQINSSIHMDKQFHHDASLLDQFNQLKMALTQLTTNETDFNDLKKFLEKIESVEIRQNIISTIEECGTANRKEWFKVLKLILSLIDNQILVSGEASLKTWDTLIEKFKEHPQELLQLLAEKEIDFNTLDFNDKSLPVSSFNSVINSETSEAIKTLSIHIINPNEKTESLIQKVFEREDSREFKQLVSDANIQEIFDFVKSHPNYIESPLMQDLEYLKKEETKQFFAENPNLFVAHLYYTMEFEKSEEIFLNLLKDPAYTLKNFAELLSINETIFEYISSSFQDRVIQWVLKQDMSQASLSDQRKIIFAIVPNGDEFFDKESGGLSTTGIELIVTYLKNKNSIHAESPVSVCKDRATFEEKLEQLAKSSVENGYSHLFIVGAINKNEYTVNTHVTPLYLKKEKGQWQIIITDSIETEQHNNNNYVKSLLDSIYKIESKFPSTFNISHVYLNNISRQSDGSNCAIFSLRDIAYFSQNGNIFLESLEANASNEKIQYFDTLPAQLRKGTQSLSELQKYIQNKRFSDELMLFTRKNSDGVETFQDNVARHTEFHPILEKNVNNLITNRSEKYQKLIIDNILRNLNHGLS